MCGLIRVMVKKKKVQVKSNQEMDSVYLFKLVLYLVLGSQWLRITRQNMQIPIPYGLIIGIVLVSKDRLKIDRKIEYPFLIIAAFVAFWLPIGIELSL